VDALDGGVDAAPDVGVADGAPEAAVEAEAGSPSYVEEVAADAPASWWRFGESDPSQAARDEMNVQAGTYETPGITLGVPGAIAGDPNTAVSFDETSGTIKLSGDLYDLGGSPPFAIEVWVSPGPAPDADASDPDRRIFSHRTDSPFFGWYLLLQPDQTLSFTRWDQNAVVGQLASPPLATGAFSHVVVSSDGTTMTLYVNGASVDTEPAGAVTPNVSANALTWGSNSDLSGQYFGGALDEGAIYGHALAPARVLAHYHAGIGK